MPNSVPVYLEPRCTHNLYGTQIHKVWTKIKKSCCSEWLDLLVLKEWADNNGWHPEKRVFRYNENEPYSEENCYLEFGKIGYIVEREHGQEIRDSEATPTEIAIGLNINRTIIDDVRKGRYNL